MMYGTARFSCRRSEGVRKEAAPGCGTRRFIETPSTGKEEGTLATSQHMEETWLMATSNDDPATPEIIGARIVNPAGEPIAPGKAVRCCSGVGDKAARR